MSFRVCEPEVVVASYAVGFIQIFRGSLVVCLLLPRSRMMRANNRVHYDPTVVSVCLHTTVFHYHNYADLSQGIGLLKCLSDTFCLECMFKIKSILSIIFHAIYETVRIRITHFSCDE